MTEGVSGTGHNAPLKTNMTNETPVNAAALSDSLKDPLNTLVDKFLVQTKSNIFLDLDNRNLLKGQVSDPLDQFAISFLTNDDFQQAVLKQIGEGVSVDPESFIHFVHTIYHEESSSNGGVGSDINLAMQNNLFDLPGYQSLPVVHVDLGNGRVYALIRDEANQNYIPPDVDGIGGIMVEIQVVDNENRWLLTEGEYAGLYLCLDAHVFELARHFDVTTQQDMENLLLMLEGAAESEFAD